MSCQLVVVTFTIVNSFFYRNESFIFAASPPTTKVFIWVHDHKTIGKDKELGDAEVEVSHLFLYFWSSCPSLTFIKDLASSQDSRNVVGRHHRRAQTGGSRPAPIRI